MAAFTTQIRRFQEARPFDGPLSWKGVAREVDHKRPMVRALSTLRAQTTSLMLDTTVKEQEASCRSAMNALLRAGKGDDLSVGKLGFISCLPRFNPVRSLSGRNRVSERLGALAAWKWVDLLDATEAARFPLSERKGNEIDSLVATINGLLAEAMLALVGELAATPAADIEAALRARRKAASLIAHEEKQRR